MRRGLAAALLVAVFAGLLVMWSADRWATTVAQAGVLAVASMWACSLFLDRAALPSGVAPLPLIGILCWGAAQLACGWTVYPWQTSEAMLYWFTNLLALTVASSLSQDPAIGRLLRKWLFVCGAALCVISVIQNFTSDGRVFWIFQTPSREDLWGPFLYKNQYAAFIELLLPVAWVRALAGEHNRWPYFVVSAALFACVVASVSRTGLVLATAELVVTGAILLFQRAISLSRLARAFVPFLLLAALFTAVVGPETVWARLQEHDPYGERGQWTVASLAMLRDRPVTGFGLGTWPTVYPGYATTDDGVFVNQAHNDWAQAAAEGGVPVFLCLAALFVWCVRASWRNPWGLGLSFVLLHALVDYPIQRQALGTFFFLFAGVVAQAWQTPPDEFSPWRGPRNANRDISV
jgi:O-antigen ligase